MKNLFKYVAGKRFKAVSLVLVAVILTVSIAGCTSSSSYKGWSGVAVSGNNLYVGAQNGTVVGMNASDRTRLFNPVILNVAVSGGLLGCGGGTISQFVYGTPLIV